MSDSYSPVEHEMRWPALGFVADNHRRAAATASEQASAAQRTQLYAAAGYFGDVEIIDVDEAP